MRYVPSRIVYLCTVLWLSGMVSGLAQTPEATSPSETKPDTAPATAVSPKHKLAYQFRVEHPVHYESLQRANIVAQSGETQDTSNNKTESRKHIRVLSVQPDGTAEVELIIDWVRMTQQFDDSPPTVFDTAKPDPALMKKFQQVVRSVGTPQFRLVCSPTGKVLKVTPLNAKPGQPAPAIPADKFMFLTQLPDQPIAIGETWSETFDTTVTVEDNNLQRTVSLKRTYKLEQVEKSQAEITFKTATLTPIKDPKVLVQLIQQTTFGRLTFDLEKGQVVRRKVETDGSEIGAFGPNSRFVSQSILLETLQTAPPAAEPAQAANADSAAATSSVMN